MKSTNSPAKLALFLCLLCLPVIYSPVWASHFANLKGNPGLKSASAVVVDADGKLIYGKDIDTVRPIASVTKLMTAMTLIDSGVDLTEKITVSKEDRDLVQLTGSRLEYGASLSRREMILIAVMASENRAATVLGRTFPGGMSAFVAAMNAKARELGMVHSNFADPAGLHVENQASASDLAKMVSAAYEYPLIREASTNTYLEVRPYRGRGPLVYGNTNRLLLNKKWDISVSKTGYIMEAGRCLVMQAKIEGESVFIVLLNSYGKLTPFGDSNRLRNWMLKKKS
ncbi:MAG: D-alanyl-D-alanine endopeptidase (penicillin-binding protein 7) [Lysobacterales bacterium]|jgi:D-alanyl-D-alanine endopeptidase (penicillin-binding protein 7)